MKVAIFALASLAAATASIEQPLVESPVVWEVEAFKDGPTLKLVGTIQEVHEQLVAINPNYDTDFNLGAVSDKAARDLSKRTDFSHSHTICGNFPGTTVDHLGQGISYLRGVGGRPSMGGRGTCGRVSCSYNTAIWWCNDVSAAVYSLNRKERRLLKRRYNYYRMPILKHLPALALLLMVRSGFGISALAVSTRDLPRARFLARHSILPTGTSLYARTSVKYY